jgi:tetratricopeptide (TPR) repeat protein
MNIVKKISLLCLPCFLLACSTIPKLGSENDTVQPISKPQVVQDQKQITSIDHVIKASTVVSSLLEQAWQQEQNDEQQAAEDSLDRAIRIAPRFPESYFRLAELYYKQGKYIQARSLAQKALSLGADGNIRRQALLLVERVSAAQL